MKKYKSLLILVLFVTAGATSRGQSSSSDDISEKKLKEHISFLASDSLNGRSIGTTENNIAAEYLKHQLIELNLSRTDDQYFQQFLITSYSFDSENSVISSVNNNGRKKRSVKNFIPLNQQEGTINIEGELIFAGFGFNNQQKAGTGNDKNKYRGKIVIYSAGTPELHQQQHDYYWNNALERNKIDELLKSGAKALLLVTGTSDAHNTFYHQLAQRRFRESYSLAPVSGAGLKNVFIVTPQTAGKLLGINGKWEKLLSSFPGGKPLGVGDKTSKRVQIRSVVKSKEVEAKNVIGIVEGSDSLLRNECIVFTAHYDHIKSNDPEVIYNGADDNASGVATLLEVARMISSSPKKFRRSIVFLFPTAEETGLLGSEYYSLNPAFPLEKTVACINLDMVGRVYEERDSVWDGTSKPVKDFNGIYALINSYSPSLKAITSEACSALDLEPDFTLPARFFYSSDHYHFHKNSVPVLNLSTGYTADYHKPTDTADRIRTDKTKRVARLCFLVASELANP